MPAPPSPNITFWYALILSMMEHFVFAKYASENNS